MNCELCGRKAVIRLRWVDDASYEWDGNYIGGYFIEPIHPSADDILLCGECNRYGKHPKQLMLN